MTDEQFRALKTLILDMQVEIKGLAVSIRAMDRRLVALEASMYEAEGEMITSEELVEFLAARSDLQIKS